MKDREDILLSRVAGREDDLADWDALDRIAGDDAELWRRLASTLRSDAALRGALTAPMRVADGVEAPVGAPPVGAPRTAPFGRWTHWAAACLIVVGIGLGYVVGRAGDGVSGQAENRELSPEQHLAAYVRSGVESGTVVGQLPDIVVRQAASRDGEGMDLFVMRRLVERRLVTGAIDVAFDEHGRPVATPVSARAPSKSTSF